MFFVFPRALVRAGVCAIIALICHCALAWDGAWVDPSNPVSENLPPWIGASVSTVSGGLARVEIPIKDFPGTGRLAATIVFEDIKDGFLRVMWESDGASVMLCDNIREGTGLLNKRTITISRDNLVLSSGGRLVLQASSDKSGIFGIMFEQVEPCEIFIGASLVSKPAVLLGSGGMVSVDESSGAVLRAETDRFSGKIVSAALVDKPVSAESGAIFVAELERLPRMARMEMRVLGMPLGYAGMVKVNGAAPVVLNVEVPVLSDPGYVTAVPGVDFKNYAGWRKASAYVPVELLKDGENTLDVFWVESLETLDAPAPVCVAMKDVMFDLDFGGSSPNVVSADSGAKILAPANDEVKLRQD